ncbi:YkgJ family cysteine cluster protein [Streptomyces sp. NEAU-W12]|uniref:YkgJ family cysteine cluster protein n=1 Tax=Streptomyces sp. NEAU-W12 TaxID=2994668 RepID=UPI00224A4CB3|nr:YkgJ family cysteine cluster protein [Streptomyces sp. NEAU-W12]MCX2923762.1 YkgJ family cysteine cluster protein [Streptomyces sp. NEAU-W12]
MNGSGANVAGCATCTGDCCRRYKVGVTAADMRRVAAGTALHPEEFITLLKDDTGFKLVPEGPTLDLYLVRRPETGGCVFLMEIDSGKARCGVYAHRPLVCSNFPTTLERGAVGIRQDTVCGPDSWNLAAMELTTYRRDLERNREAWAEHRRLIRKWNAAVERGERERTARELYDFLLGPDWTGR